MTRRAGDPDDDAAAFAEAVRGTRALSGARRVPADLGSGTVKRPRVPAPATTAVLPSGRALSVEDTAQGWIARADGVDRRVLRKLREGTIPVEGRVDLHGLTRVNALAALERFLSTARAADQRCLLVIHGRGLHSGDEGPTLRDVVRDALSTGALSGVVLACTQAPPSQGGAGATLVYLRR
jgi:DNA-nicking Smr family endonuclease